jgi:hypothetical protein
MGAANKTSDQRQATQNVDWGIKSELPLLAESVEKVGGGPVFWCPLLVRADIFSLPQ